METVTAEEEVEEETASSEEEAAPAEEAPPKKKRNPPTKKIKGTKAPHKMAGRPKKEAKNGHKTGIAVDPATAKKIRQLRAEMELKTGDRVSIGMAVRAAIDAALK